MTLCFNNVTLGYADKVVIRDFSAELASGSLIAVTGRNGSGKSTFLKAIAGLLQPIRGTIVKPKKGYPAYLPQQCGIDRTFPINVKTLVKTGLWSLCGLWKNQRPYRDKIQNALEIVGLSEQADFSLDLLSSGQLQRALFARIIVQDSNIILLDEPFNGVDLLTQKDILRLITHWKKQGRTIIVALHDRLMIRDFFPLRMHIDAHHILYGETEKFFEETDHNITPLFKSNSSTIALREQRSPKDRLVQIGS